ncbi:ABC transporter substrate-binding protein [Paenibacillus sp. OAS669]|uniref:ABC transporter substrate-binding protein n=1 Tax=Paenibacillus sp. OAS669 TaxID=2663821 RepID=UPI00178BE42F|nr:ABC transporter substrate-binding protein [Paenibacillus sp. OAS669]MBE1446541.1 peptide/nickel transport system substrate-binding protein [Paenibacillus sp. OAS669]
MKGKWMKASVSVLALALLLTACGGNRSATGPDPADKAENKNEAGLSSVKDGLIKASDLSKNPETAKKRTTTFISGTQTPEGVFNPYFYQNGWDGNVTGVLFASLITKDETGKPIPELAEKWDTSADQLTYTFHLRPNLKFSDGTPLTAEDVAFTLTLLHDPAYDGRVDISQAYIKGGAAYKEKKADTVEGIKVIDPLTIQFTTEKVTTLALPLLGGEVLSKAYYGKEYKQGNLDYIKTLHDKPLGAGPYQFDKFIKGQEVRFTANPNYYAGKPAVENFIFKITNNDTNLQYIKVGETDYDRFTANRDNFDQLKALGFVNINTFTAISYVYLDFNSGGKFLKDKRVRQALYYGLDRQKFTDILYQGFGEVANVPVSPASWAYTKEVTPYPFDPQKAKQLLDEAGWKVGADGIREKDGQKLKLQYLGRKGYNIDDVLIPLAKENFKDIGIAVEAEILDFNALLAKRKKGDFDIASFTSTNFSDPYDGVKSFHSKYNVSGYFNPKIDQLIDQGTETLDTNKRIPIYNDLYKQLKEDPPVLLLSYLKILSAHNARIQGINPDPVSILNRSIPKLKIE